MLFVSRRRYPKGRELFVEEMVIAAIAKRRFSLVLRGVRKGRSYVVTSHGKPVARLIPAGRHGEAAKRSRVSKRSRS
jgi:prevent-host-death family protein